MRAENMIFASALLLPVPAQALCTSFGVSATALDFGVYDPTFYTAIDFHTDDDLHVEGLPSTCTKNVIRPDPDKALAQNQKTLTDAFFSDPTDLSKIFATKLEIACQP